jgi:hypothetical protein
MARTTRVTVRVTPAQLDALNERAKAAGLPVRTFMQRLLTEPVSDGAEQRAIFNEVRKGTLLTQRLWLAAAQNEEARAAIMRIVTSVEASLL